MPISFLNNCYFLNYAGKASGGSGRGGQPAYNSESSGAGGSSQKQSHFGGNRGRYNKRKYKKPDATHKRDTPY